MVLEPSANGVVGFWRWSVFRMGWMYSASKVRSLVRALSSWPTFISLLDRHEIMGGHMLILNNEMEGENKSSPLASSTKCVLDVLPSTLSSLAEIGRDMAQ